MVQHQQYKMPLVCLTCLLLMLPLGCSTTTRNVAIDSIGEMPEPLIEPLPLNVGVHYTDNFRTYKTTQTNVFEYGYTYILNLRLGDANVALFNYLFDHAFKNTTPLSHLPTDTEASIDFIIEPDISEYVWYWEGITPLQRISIAYEIRLFSPDGIPFNSWSIRMEKQSGESIKKITEEAMRDIATKFFTDFCGQTKINEMIPYVCEQ